MRSLAVWVGGLVAGALDIGFALSFAAFKGVPPTRLLQSIASGLLGAEAYAGGVATAALGLGLHFAMALAFAAAFLLAARRFRVLVRHPIVLGSAYGVAVFLFIRLLVLPLSAFPHPVSFKPLATTLDLMSHMFLFGVPIALMVRKALHSASETAP